MLTEVKNSAFVGKKMFFEVQERHFIFGKNHVFPGRAVPVPSFLQAVPCVVFTVRTARSQPGGWERRSAFHAWWISFLNSKNRERKISILSHRAIMRTRSCPQSVWQKREDLTFRLFITAADMRKWKS